MLQSESLSSPEVLTEALDVSRRTLFRDLQTLQDAGVPCFFDHTDGRYKIKGSFYMPPPHFSEQEAFSLLLLVHKAREFLDVPFNQHITNAVLKIESQLPPQLKEYCRQKLKNISVLSARSKAKESRDEQFLQIQQAIQNRRILSITYYCKSKKKITTCNFSPLHIAYTNTWHVIGKTNLERCIQTIRLDAIERIESTGKCFLDSQEFNPYDFFGRAWSSLPEGKLYNISLKFSPEVAKEVTSVKWHSTQYSKIQEDGTAILEFRVDGLDEITRWIIGFGDKVYVIRPRILREKIRETAMNIFKQNKPYGIDITLPNFISQRIT